jgi:hypothetical protein
MSKLFKTMSQNKNRLFIGALFICIFSFLPLQNTNLNLALAETYSCQPLGGIANNYSCTGSLPAGSCSAIGDGTNNCVSRCRDAGGQTARLGAGTAGDPFKWYCCNLPVNTTCGPSNSLTVNAASANINLIGTTISGWNSLGDGLYICDDEGCLDPTPGAAHWRFVAPPEIKNICDTDVTQGYNTSDKICGQIGSIRIVGALDVILYENNDYLGKLLCLSGTGSSAYKLDDYNITSNNGWNQDTDSIKIFSNSGGVACGGQTVSITTDNESNPIQSVSITRGKTFVPASTEEQNAQWCPGVSFGWALLNPGNAAKAILCLIQYYSSFYIKIPFFMVSIPIALLGIVLGFLYSIIATFTGWIATVSLTIPITPSNPAMSSDFIVAQAWRFTRDFADMFLLLILVFIGLATILKIKEYEVRKLLPALVIVALLINFSPVLVGLMVDLGNIVAKFFIDAAGEVNNLGTIASTFVNYMQQNLNVFTMDGAFIQRLFGVYEGTGNYAAQMAGILAYGIILCAFYIYATGVYIMVAILFIYRVVWLWILTILAPIAFLFSILPATQKVYMLGWRDWIGHLFQWVILGIPIGFFLWLSNWVMKTAGQAQVSGLFNTAGLSANLGNTISNGDIAKVGYLGDGLAALIGNILAPLIAIIILQMGVKFAKKMAPEAALKMVESIEKLGKMAATGALVAVTMGGAGAALGARALSGAAKSMGRVDKTLGRVGLHTNFGTNLEKQAEKLRRTNPSKDMKDMGAEKNVNAQQDYIDRQGTSRSSELKKLETYGWAGEEGMIGRYDEKHQKEAIVLAEKYANDPHYKKAVREINKDLISQATAKSMIMAEGTVDDQNKKRAKIKERAVTFTEEAKNDRDGETSKMIQEEKSAVVKKNFKGREWNSLNETERQQAETEATENLAARYIQFTELKASDIKELSKGSVKSKIAGKALRDMTSGHLQAIQNNFDTDTANEAINNTFVPMFEGKTPAQAEEIIKNYYSGGGDQQLANKHGRMVRFLSDTQAGREFNTPIKVTGGKKKYDKLDAYRDAEIAKQKETQTNTEIDAKEARLEAEERLKGKPDALKLEKADDAKEAKLEQSAKLNRRNEQWEREFKLEEKLVSTPGGEKITDRDDQNKKDKNSGKKRRDFIIPQPKDKTKGQKNKNIDQQTVNTATNINTPPIAPTTSKNPPINQPSSNIPEGRKDFPKGPDVFPKGPDIPKDRTDFPKGPDIPRSTNIPEGRKDFPKGPDVFPKGPDIPKDRTDFPKGPDIPPSMTIPPKSPNPKGPGTDSSASPTDSKPMTKPNADEIKSATSGSSPANQVKALSEEEIIKLIREAVRKATESRITATLEDGTKRDLNPTMPVGQHGTLFFADGKSPASFSKLKKLESGGEVLFSAGGGSEPENFANTVAKEALEEIQKQKNAQSSRTQTVPENRSKTEIDETLKRKIEELKDLSTKSGAGDWVSRAPAQALADKGAEILGKSGNEISYADVAQVVFDAVNKYNQANNLDLKLAAPDPVIKTKEEAIKVIEGLQKEFAKIRDYSFRVNAEAINKSGLEFLNKNEKITPQTFADWMKKAIEAYNKPGF